MSDNYKINREKFLGELKKRNLNMADIAREMGYSTKYLSNKVREGRPFSKGDINFLNAVYHLPYDNYKYEEKKEQVIEKKGTENKGAASLSSEELKQIIHDAVYEAMKDAAFLYNKPVTTFLETDKSLKPPYDITCETQETLPFA